MKASKSKRSLAFLLNPVYSKIMAKDTKHRIARAALDLFVQDGFDAATTRQIAARCGLSEGAIYRHYASKDDIARELFLSIHRQLTLLVPESAAGVATIDEAVGKVVLAYCTVADEDWTLYAFHLLQLHRFLGYWKDEDGDPVSAVAALIEAAMSDHQLPPGNSELLAGMALGIITQTAQNKAYGRISVTLEQLAPAFTSAILAVLRAR